MQNSNERRSPNSEDDDARPESASQQPKSRRGDQTRTRILDAAEEVFGRRGYHGASIVEITRQAGVGLGTFYLYFPSKLDIFKHLLRSRQAEFIHETRRAAEGATDQREVIQSAFRAYFEWMSQRPNLLRMFREAEFVDPSLLAELYRAPAKAYKDRLVRAMEQGYVDTTLDPEVLAWCLMGMTEFCTLRWIVWPRDDDFDTSRYDAFVEIISRALGVGTQPSVTP
ncbi:MAG: TetR/AcrR family transcriptional regulator [Actinomycetota bacterium]